MYMTQPEQIRAREDNIVRVLKSARDGLTLREITEAVEGKYPTIRLSVISLVNKGRVEQTLQYRNGSVYRAVADFSMPLLFEDSKPLTLWDLLQKYGTRPMTEHPPLISAGLIIFKDLSDLLIYGNVEQDTTSARLKIRTRLQAMKANLDEMSNNIEILLSNDNLWDKDAALRKTLRLPNGTEKWMSDVTSVIKEDVHHVGETLKKRRAITNVQEIMKK